jgi:outer membrane protein X
MKTKKIIIATVLFFAGFMVSQAQIDTRIGAELAYGTEIENLGIGANAEFGVLDNLSISPSFIYYLPKEEGPIKINWFEVNANANYYFIQDEKFDVYGIGGLNYTSVKVKYDSTYSPLFGESSSVSDGRIGLNLGGGANLNLDGNITPFAELKYVIIDGGQLVLAAGVKFKI